MDSQGNFIYKDNTKNTKTIPSTAYFFGDSINEGIVNRGLFYENSSNIHDVKISSFFDSTTNLGSSVSASFFDQTINFSTNIDYSNFYNNSVNKGVTQNVIFNNNTQNLSTVNSALFTDESVNTSTTVTSAVFTKDSINNGHVIYGVFEDDAVNNGTVTHATFKGDSINNGNILVSGNFKDNSNNENILITGTSNQITYYWFSDYHTVPTSTHVNSVDFLSENVFWEEIDINNNEPGSLVVQLTRHYTNNTNKIINLRSEQKQNNTEQVSIFEPNNLIIRTARLKRTQLPINALYDTNVQIFLLGENIPIFTLDTVNNIKCNIKDRYILYTKYVTNKTIVYNNVSLPAKQITCIVSDEFQSALQNINNIICQSLLLDNVFINSTNIFSEYTDKLNFNNCVIKTSNNQYIPQYPTSKILFLNDTTIIYNNSVIYKALKANTPLVIYPTIECKDNTYFKVQSSHYTVDGFNGYFNAGTGFNNALESPAVVSGEWLKIVSGNNFYIALKSDNTLWGWGFNFVSTDGSSVFGSRFNNNPFLTVPTLIDDNKDWFDVAAGDNFFVALKKTETEYLILGRGDNSYQQIGNQYYIDSDFLIVDRDDINNIQPEIKACGNNLYYNLLRTSLNLTGEWYGRGDNSFKQLLDDNIACIVKTSIITDEKLVNNTVQIFPGNGYLIYKTKNNIYYGRGRNDNKQLIFNNELQMLGLTVLPLTGDFISMCLNNTTCVGVTRNRKIYLWGNDYNSQELREPHEIFENDEWEQAIVSEKAIIALNTEGTIYMYGELVT